MRVTAQLYGQFLVSSQVNYTGTYLADHLDGLTHDNVRYFLKTQRFTPRQLWQQVRPQVVLSAWGYVLFDDTVLDKHHSRRIELVRRQCSSGPGPAANVGGLLANAGAVLVGQKREAGRNGSGSVRGISTLHKMSCRATLEMCTGSNCIGLDPTYGIFS